MAFAIAQRRSLSPHGRFTPAPPADSLPMVARATFALVIPAAVRTLALQARKLAMPG